ncbi:hypothetical protein [uncultured Shimia sp.]|nr:hypothetical protein [uncultured Shimia sp.]
MRLSQSTSGNVSSAAFHAVRTWRIEVMPDHPIPRRIRAIVSVKHSD